MAKGQRSQREKRKPKSDKPKLAPQASPFARTPGSAPATTSAPPKKSR